MAATGMAQASLSTRAMPVKWSHLLPVHRTTGIVSGKKKPGLSRAFLYRQSGPLTCVSPGR